MHCFIVLGECTLSTFLFLFPLAGDGTEASWILGKPSSLSSTLCPALLKNTLLLTIVTMLHSRSVELSHPNWNLYPLTKLPHYLFERGQISSQVHTECCNPVLQFFSPVVSLPTLTASQVIGSVPQAYSHFKCQWQVGPPGHQQVLSNLATIRVPWGNIDSCQLFTIACEVYKPISGWHE